MTAQRLEDARTFLFVPGSRPDRFDKALDSGADIVILDLEDAVPPDEKDEARRHVVGWLEAGGRAAVRINAVGTPWCAADLEAVGLAAAVVLPKAEGSDDLCAAVDLASTPVPLVPLIETARGVLAAQEICHAPGVVRVGLGNMDLATDLGVHPSSRPALAAARSHLVYASRAGGLASPIDGVTTQLRDQELLAEEARYARELGFGAKLTIHPAQVPVVAEVFGVTPEEIAWAEDLLSAPEAGAYLRDGHMVDEPVLARARAILRRAGRGLPDASTSGP